MITEKAFNDSAIYKIYSLANPLKFYIGSSIHFKKRKARHIKSLSQNNHANIKLQNHFNKYGADDLVFEIIEVINDNSIILKREQFYIDSLSPFFNIALSSTAPHLGRKHSEATKQMMRLKRKGLNKGVKFSEDHKRNLSLAKKGTQPSLGRILSNDTKDKIRNSIVALGNKGKKQSEEQILSRLGEQMKSVIDVKTGETYKSITIAAKSHGINRNTLYGWLHDERRNITTLKLQSV